MVTCVCKRDLCERLSSSGSRACQTWAGMIVACSASLVGWINNLRELKLSLQVAPVHKELEAYACSSGACGVW